MKRKLSDNEINFIIENYENKGSLFCAKHLGINKSTVSSVARRKKIKVNRDVVSKNMSKSIIKINDYIHVSKKEISYVLGLIWTDGHISFSNNKSKTPIIKHSCVFYDSENSDNIFKSLNWRNFKSENNKSIGKNMMSISWLSSRDLGEYLISHNFKNKESGTFIYKNFENLTSHFLRGIFDGDGCITISKSQEKYKQTAIYFSSSKDQNWKFLTDILDSIQVKYNSRINIDKLGKSSQIFINESKSIFKLCDYMYKDSDGIRLERKYKKYLEFISYKNSIKTGALEV
jgi:hypothetical protein